MSRRIVVLVVDDYADDRLRAAIQHGDAAWLADDLREKRLQILSSMPLPPGDQP